MVDGNVTELVISGLTPGVVYTFNVAAVNEFGTGQDSNTVMAQSASPGMLNNCMHIYTTYVATYVWLI